MGELIAVLSGKGGTGKTSLCAGIATALAQEGAKVLCIDCDIGLRNLDISLAMADDGALSFLDVCQGGYDLFAGDIGVKTSCYIFYIVGEIFSGKVDTHTDNYM